MSEDKQNNVNKLTNVITQHHSSYKLEFQDFVSFKQEYGSDQDLSDTEEDFPSLITFYSEHENQTFFSEEEQAIIDTCTCPELRRLLVLNRSKNMQLIKLHKKMRNFLLECETEIEQKRHLISDMEAKQLPQQTFVWKLAAPYFKDKKFYTSPLNADAARKRANLELGVYDLVPSVKWTPIEFDRLTNAVKCNYSINRQKEVLAKISSMKGKGEKGGGQELVELRQQLKGLKEDDKIPPWGSNEHIDWFKVAETFLKDKHTPEECQSVWHTLVHPDINNSEWTDEESRTLENVARDFSFQNWDEIAKTLHTNRSGFTTCLHYFSKLCEKFKRSKFSPEEDDFLKQVVETYKVGTYIPWHKVVCHFNDRSRHQLYHRYIYFLSQNHVKKGKFSEAEDILLIILVHKFGKNFKTCAEYMPQRSQMQLKSRYNSNLQRLVKKGAFTAEEDQKIFEYFQENGEKDWSVLETEMDRCGSQIRHRYRLIKGFLKDNPGVEVADIPRRKHRFDIVNEGQHDFLHYMAEQYKDLTYIPNITMIEEGLQTYSKTQLKKTAPNSKESQSKLKNIDSMLTEFFKNSPVRTQYTAITETNLNDAAENSQQVLNLLGASLTIPKNLECDEYFDTIDLEILERLSTKSLAATSKLAAPNINTLIGLKSLIIKHKEYKSQHRVAPSSDAPQEQNLHRREFSQRFDTLLEWSAVLSLEKPNQVEPEQNPSKRPNPPASQGQATAKKRKISVAALQNLSHHPQLKLVDKRVVENLIKKNGVDVIRVESIRGANKVVLKSGPSDFNAQKASDDVLDNVKVEAHDLVVEEYEVLKDDAQLLKEVLKYDKSKVKPEPASL